MSEGGGFASGHGCGTVALGWVFGLILSVASGMLYAIDAGLAGTAYFASFVGAIVFAAIGDRWAFGSGVILGLVTIPVLFLAACFAILGIYIGTGGN